MDTPENSSAEPFAAVEVAVDAKPAEIVSAVEEKVAQVITAAPADDDEPRAQTFQHSIKPCAEPCAMEKVGWGPMGRVPLWKCEKCGFESFEEEEAAKRRPA